MVGSSTRAYQFGGFRLDLRRQQLTDLDGTVLNLSARAYDVLVYLLENRHRVVSKNELMKAVWPNTVVEENNLNQAVTIVRRALGDRRDTAQFVRTIAGRGYRFTADVSEGTAGSDPEESTATQPGSGIEPLPPPLDDELATAEPKRSLTVPNTGRRRLLIAAGLGLVAAGGVVWLVQTRRAREATPLRSLAVLPFRPLIEDTADPALELGMTDTLITKLSRLPGLVVSPLSSSRVHAARNEDPLAAGRGLDVDTVLEGHVLIRANRVRVTARLLDVASGAALWSGSFEEPVDNFFAAQEALAGQVVSALQIEMSARDRVAMLDRPTNDIRAWQLYVNGRYHWERKTPEGFRRALEYYEAAERLDPRFALAAVGQADSWAVLGVYAALPPGDAFARAGAAAERALALAPDLPEAIAAMGHVLVQGRRDWRGGERLYRQALAANPRYAQCRMWLANDAAFQGRLSEAVAEARRAQEYEPVSLTFAANVGLILYFMRDYKTARAQVEPLVEAAPEFNLARSHLARVLIESGAPAKAIALLEDHRSLAPGALSNLGRAYAATGQHELATAELHRLEQLGAQGFGVGYDVALIHAALGERDRALDGIERGARDGSQMIGFLNSEPGFDAIRNEARFREASRGLGLG